MRYVKCIIRLNKRITKEYYLRRGENMEFILELFVFSLSVFVSFLVFFTVLVGLNRSVLNLFSPIRAKLFSIKNWNLKYLIWYVVPFSLCSGLYAIYDLKPIVYGVLFGLMSSFLYAMLLDKQYMR